MRLWGGRFGDGPDEQMADFTRSIEVDRELAHDDILGSVAHVHGLGRRRAQADHQSAFPRAHLLHQHVQAPGRGPLREAARA